MTDTIICPKCHTKIEVAQALSDQLTAKIRAEVEADIAARHQKLEKELARVKKREEELAEAEESVAEKVKAGIAAERKKLAAQALKKATEDLAVELKDRDQQIADAQAKLKTAQEAELALRKRERKLKQEKEALELEVARKLDSERDKIRAEAKRQAAEEHSLRDAEKNKTIEAMKVQIEELRRKAEQGSQQIQGEVQELALTDVLRAKFPHDSIEPVPKGVHGADVVQRVHDTGGEDCGVILWESKRTKAWSAAWLAKLRDDQRAVKAVQAVIVTEVMPEGCDQFTCIEGVWVTNWQCAVGVAMAIRAGLIEVGKSNRALVGRQGKMELLYNYLAGPEFKNRVTGIAESFITLRHDLEDEKRAIQRLWAKREKQLERAVVNTTGLYGDLQGIVGASLAQIESLDLPRLESRTGDQDSNAGE